MEVLVQRVKYFCNRPFLQCLKSQGVTLQNKRYPVESALFLDSSSGWVDGEEGMQVIRVVLDEPQNIQRVMP